jgi:transposase-like protein
MGTMYMPLEQTMEHTVRQRRSESAWREIVARQQQSGQTVQKFCEREGLKAANLYGWRVRLRQEPSGKRAGTPIPQERVRYNAPMEPAPTSMLPSETEIAWSTSCSASAGIPRYVLRS